MIQFDRLHRSNARHIVIAAMLVFTLAACGGGASTSPTQPTPPGNTAPASNAGADQSVDELSAVSLDGGASTDADGDTLTYSWTQTAGPTVTITGANAAQASFDAPDVLATEVSVLLTFQLTVNDGTVDNSDTVDVTVNDVGLGANSPPTANAGQDQTVNELTTVTLDGSGSSDADGDALTYLWQQTAGPTVTINNATSAQASFDAPDVLATNSPVTFTFELTVNDGSVDDVARGKCRSQ